MNKTDTRKTEAERINARGLAKGWHAEELQRRAKQSGQTMAALFRAESACLAGFNVPARAVSVVSTGAGFIRVNYEFLDHSTDAYVAPKRTE